MRAGPPIFALRQIAPAALSAKPLCQPSAVPGANAHKADGIDLGHYLSAKNQRSFYVYDFGDNWQHLVEAEEVVKLQEDFAIRGEEGVHV